MGIAREGSVTAKGGSVIRTWSSCVPAGNRVSFSPPLSLSPGLAMDADALSSMMLISKSPITGQSTVTGPAKQTVGITYRVIRRS